MGIRQKEKRPSHKPKPVQKDKCANNGCLEHFSSYAPFGRHESYVCDKCGNFFDVEK